MAQPPRAPKRSREDNEVQSAPADTQHAKSTVSPNSDDDLGSQTVKHAEGCNNDSTKAVISSDGLGWPGVYLLTSKINTQQAKLDA